MSRYSAMFDRFARPALERHLGEPWVFHPTDDPEDDVEIEKAVFLEHDQSGDLERDRNGDRQPRTATLECPAAVGGVAQTYPVGTSFTGRDMTWMVKGSLEAEGGLVHVTIGNPRNRESRRHRSR